MSYNLISPREILDVSYTTDVITPYSPQHTPERMLERAKKSVKNQTVETNHIVVQDEDQRGPGWARNKGLEKSKNRFVAFLDADDYWKDEKLEKQLKEIEEGGKGLCLCKSKAGENVNNPVRSTEKQFVKDVFLEEIVSLTPTIVIDSSKVSSRFNEDFYRREDHLYALEAVNERGICFVDEVLCFIDKHDKGASSLETIDGKKSAYEDFFDRATDVYPFLQEYKRDYWKNAFHRLSRTAYYEKDFLTARKYALNSVESKPGLRNTANLAISVLRSLSS